MRKESATKPMGDSTTVETQLVIPGCGAHWDDYLIWPQRRPAANPAEKRNLRGDLVNWIRRALHEDCERDIPLP
eukprot:CAMPEP_0172775612 /NCGR_PEP_ID=MMETSP1074-20121228/198285_1 /TAXON_ID=2916 /ORGANISM="Ceratium fusus, Strain PA161109" /LENGTH=73 /DNA_ID=CAMNT_0013612253 /DNA_START=8 /DNA_END=226 /DNA_ORIENTATION=-